MAHGPALWMGMLAFLVDFGPAWWMGAEADLKHVVREAGEGQGSRGRPRNIWFTQLQYACSHIDRAVMTIRTEAVCQGDQCTVTQTWFGAFRGSHAILYTHCFCLPFFLSFSVSGKSDPLPVSSAVTAECHLVFIPMCCSFRIHSGALGCFTLCFTLYKHMLAVDQALNCRFNCNYWGQSKQTQLLISHW